MSDYKFLVDAELERIKPQLTRHEWFTLKDVLEKSLYRIITSVLEQKSHD